MLVLRICILILSFRLTVPALIYCLASTVQAIKPTFDVDSSPACESISTHAPNHDSYITFDLVEIITSQFSSELAQKIVTSVFFAGALNITFNLFQPPILISDQLMDKRNFLTK